MISSKEKERLTRLQNFIKNECQDEELNSKGERGLGQLTTRVCPPIGGHGEKQGARKTLESKAFRNIACILIGK